MARLFTSGFEFNSVLPTEDFSDFTNFSIVTSPVRSGTYAGRSHPSASSSICQNHFSASNLTTPLYFRAYIYLAAAPTSAARIMTIRNVSASNKIAVSCNTDRTLRVINVEDVATIGTDSAALELNTWYRLELKVDTTTISATAVEAKLDGVVFGSGTANLASGVGRFVCGFDGADATLDIYYDDLAVNNSSGSYQNSYPGAGSVIRLKPNAAGDANTFATQVGGTVGASNNFTRVNEIDPDSGTSVNGSNTLDQTDMFNVDASGIAANSVVNVVGILSRWRNQVSADATTEAKMQIEKTSGGTIEQSAGIILNSTTFSDFWHATYVDPDGAPWTQATLDTMQIGYKLTTGGTNRLDCTSISAIVDYGPGVAGNHLLLLRAG